MTDTTIFYALAMLGVIVHMVGKIWQRDGTVLEWIKEGYNVRYLIATILGTVVFVLIGPGDGSDLGSSMARGFAFTAAATGCEAIRVMILGPKRTAERKAVNAAK